MMGATAFTVAVSTFPVSAVAIRRAAGIAATTVMIVWFCSTATRTGSGAVSAAVKTSPVRIVEDRRGGGASKSDE